MRVGVVAQRGNARAAYLAAELRAVLDGSDTTVWLDTATAGALDLDGVDVAEFDSCDLVVSIGGDGTFLFAARGAGSTPVMGVNLGEVGFLNAVAPADAVAAVQAEVERYQTTGSVRHREVPRVRATGDGAWALTPAINEVVVQGPQRGPRQGLEVEVRVDGSLYASGHADGVLVATPTGSTAYNLSEGGPLVHPGVPALVVTMLCPAESMPPLAVALESDVAVRVDGPDTATVSSDGSRTQTVDTPEVVTIRAADQPARVAGPESDFFQALNKLE
jgi:NAD+ kinase